MHAVTSGYKEEIQTLKNSSAGKEVDACRELTLLFSGIHVGTAIQLTEAIRSFEWPQQVETIHDLQITDKELEHLTNFIANRILENAKTPVARFPWVEESKW